MFTVAIDIDNTIADTMGAFVPYANRVLKTDVRVVDEWNLTTVFGTPWVNDVLKEFLRYEQGTIRPMSGAGNGVRSLLATGFDLTFVTARSPRFRLQTQTWLHHHGLKPPTVYETNKHHLHRPDVLIDDSPTQIQSWVQTGRPAIMLDQPYNRRPSSYPLLRAHSWHEIPSLIEQIHDGQWGELAVRPFADNLR